METPKQPDRMTILTWLSDDWNSPEYDHSRYQRERVDNSGIWFLTSPAFQEWVKNTSGGPNLLFCHGISNMLLSCVNNADSIEYSRGWKDFFDVLCRLDAPY